MNDDHDLEITAWLIFLLALSILALISAWMLDNRIPLAI